jgi:hypothetical protein
MKAKGKKARARPTEVRLSISQELQHVAALSELAEWVVSARKFVFAIDADINDVPTLAMDVRLHSMIDDELAWGSEVEGLGILLGDINRRLHSIKQAPAVESRRKLAGAR